MKVAIVVLNYDGRRLLEHYLPSVVESAKRSRYICRVAVVHNGPDDGSEAFVRLWYPQVEWVTAPTNAVLCSYNDYAAAVAEPILIFLNNDIRVGETFVDPLVRALENDPKAFFASPKVINSHSGEYEGSKSKLEFRWGLPWGSARFPGYERGIDIPGKSMQCGFGAFRRDLFLELGGYDDLYLPGTVEDMDLCFRAYRKGYCGLYCPESVVYHVGQATFRKTFGASGILSMNRRNLFLFVWKNLRDPGLLALHFLILPLHLFKNVLFWETDLLSGFFEALKRLPEAMQRRERESSVPTVRQEREVFRISRGIGC